MIGFQGEVPASALGDVNVPAAAVPRLVLHFVSG